MNSVRCRFSDETKKVVCFYLRRRAQALRLHHGGCSLAEGVPDINIIRRTFDDDVMSRSGTGSPRACGTDIPYDLDMVKIRRRIEDHLRKSASSEDIIRIALCLGVKLR
jgi:hypothetical protein